VDSCPTVGRDWEWRWEASRTGFGVDSWEFKRDLGGIWRAEGESSRRGTGKARGREEPWRRAREKSVQEMTVRECGDATAARGKVEGSQS
jgi:hypothetical protein